MPRLLRTLAVLAVLHAAPTTAAPPVDDVDMVVGASGENGGQLLVVHDFGRPIRTSFSVSADGLTRWTSTQPGFDAVDPLTEAGPGFHPVRAGTPIRVELLAADPGASFKLGTTVLDAPGASAFVANAPDLHVHGEWRLVLPDDVRGAFQIALRLTTTSPAYRASPPYVFVLVNDPDVSIPTTTLPDVGRAPDVLLAGRRLRLRAARTGWTLSLRAGDRGVPAIEPGGADDPSVGGAALVIAGPQGTATLALPAVAWAVRKGGRVLRYADPRGAAGPVRAVRLKTGKRLVLTARSDTPGLDLATDPGPLRVVLTFGTRRTCLVFGGTTSWKPGTRWNARNAPAPAACE
ncbi:MAG: hypothetical protein KIT14_12375 [bacterium]|nr:hypothetical protein [bacterium]